MRSASFDLVLEPLLLLLLPCLFWETGVPTIVVLFAVVTLLIRPTLLFFTVAARNSASPPLLDDDDGRCCGAGVDTTILDGDVIFLEFDGVSKWLGLLALLPKEVIFLTLDGENKQLGLAVLPKVDGVVATMEPGEVISGKEDRKLAPLNVDGAATAGDEATATTDGDEAVTIVIDSRMLSSFFLLLSPTTSALARVASWPIMALLLLPPPSIPSPLVSSPLLSPDALLSPVFFLPRRFRTSTWVGVSTHEYNPPSLPSPLVVSANMNSSVFKAVATRFPVRK